MLRNRIGQKTLSAFLAWLLDPGHFPKIRSSRTQPTLRKITQEISHLKRIPGCFIDRAVSNLRKEAQLIRDQAVYRTYESRSISRNAPKALGNIEETERLYLAGRIVRQLHPQSNPYVFLRDRLAERGDHRTSEAIQMRITRFEKVLQEGGHFDCTQIAQQQYLRFKGWLIWESPFAKDQSRIGGPASRAGKAKRGPWRDLAAMAQMFRITESERRLLEGLCSDGLSAVRGSLTARPYATGDSVIQGLLPKSERKKKPQKRPRYRD